TSSPPPPPCRRRRPQPSMRRRVRIQMRIQPLRPEPPLWRRQRLRRRPPNSTPWASPGPSSSAGWRICSASAPEGPPMEDSQLREALQRAGYVADPDLATALWLAGELQRPLLVEGDAGVGK